MALQHTDFEENKIIKIMNSLIISTKEVRLFFRILLVKPKNAYKNTKNSFILNNKS